MADQAVHELTNEASPTSDDVLYLEDDPGSGQNDRKLTLDNLRIWLDSVKPRAKMSRDAVQTIGTGAYTRVQFDNNAEFAAVGITATIGASARFTILEDGEYLIHASWRCPGVDAQEFVFANIYVNGVSTRSGMIEAGATNRSTWAGVTDLLSLVATDYIEFYIYQSSGDNQDTDTTANWRPEMIVFKV